MFDVQLAKFIFQERTRMLEFRVNYKQKYTRTGYQCEVGCSVEYGQEHLLVCPVIPDDSIAFESVPIFEDLFSANVESQLRVASIMKEIFHKRKNILNQEWTSSEDVLVLWTHGKPAACSQVQH